MNSILHELYHGNLSPSEHYLPSNEDYQAFHEECRKRSKRFTESLDPNQRETFMRIMDDSLDLIPMDYPDVFVSGFQMGAKILFEVYQEEILGSKQ